MSMFSLTRPSCLASVLDRALHHRGPHSRFHPSAAGTAYIPNRAELHSWLRQLCTMAIDHNETPGMLELAELARRLRQPSTARLDTALPAMPPPLDSSRVDDAGGTGGPVLPVAVAGVEWTGVGLVTTPDPADNLIIGIVTRVEAYVVLPSWLRSLMRIPINWTILAKLERRRVDKEPIASVTRCFPSSRTPLQLGCLGGASRRYADVSGRSLLC